LTLQVGTVFKWEHFPFPRYSDETKPRWFIYLSETGPFAQIAWVYLCTTTTQTDRFQIGGSRAGHSYFKFEVRQFSLFEKDCIVDFDDPPHSIKKAQLLNKHCDISIKGRLKEETMRMIYNRFLQSGACAKKILLDIHDSFNREGISGLKKPK